MGCDVAVLQSHSRKPCILGQNFGCADNVGRAMGRRKAHAAVPEK